MTLFHVKSRRKSPILFDTVEAETRDDAIHAMVLAVPSGEEIEIMTVQEGPFSDAPVDGATGATGATGPAATSRHK